MKEKEKRGDAWLFLLLTFLCVGSFPKQRVVIKHTCTIPHNLKAWQGQLCKCSIPGLYRHRNDPNHRNDLRHRNDPQSPPK